MKIKIDALDTLFFRDGKPFSLGEETWADGLFPPSPSVFYGALRGLYFSQTPKAYEKANIIAGDDTKRDLSLDMAIKGIYFLVDEQPHFICPLDYVQEKDSRTPEPYVLDLQKIPQEVQSDQPLPYWLKAPDTPKVENIAGMLDLISLKRYATKHQAVGAVQRWSAFLQTEPKVGIGRNKMTNTTREGLLYRVGMVRPAFPALKNEALDEITASKRLSIVIDFDHWPGAAFPEQGFLKLGGEGKAVHFERYDQEIKIPTQVIEKEAIFKLILHTPAIFEQGWYPKWIEKKADGYQAIIPGTDLKAELIAAAIGKPVSIGGFDMQAKRPKTMYKAVPAGSVYYFKLNKPQIASLAYQNLHLATISDLKPKEGFGIVSFTQPIFNES